MTLQLNLRVNSRATFWSHSLFLIPQVPRYAMPATVAIGVGAELVYPELLTPLTRIMAQCGVGSEVQKYTQ